MRNRGLVILVGFLVAFSLIQPTAAHVPLFIVGGHSLDEAVPIENPTKSWVIYSTIDEIDEPHYFYLDMLVGERIRLMLMVPIPDGDQGFRPRLALMGDGLTNMSMPPGTLEIPSGAQVMILEPESLIPEYEGFTPTSFYVLYDLDILAPSTGRYYLAYYEPVMAGNFAIAVGYQETFSFIEWVTVPFTVLITHLWNHQAPLTIIAPILMTFLLGLVLIFWRYPRLREEPQLLTWLGNIIGLSFIASGVFIFYQMGIALLQVPVSPQIAITIIFSAIPIILGLLTIRNFVSIDWQHKPRQLIVLFILAISALFLWAGWILGPILLMLTTAIASIQLFLEYRTSPIITE
jgi:hypothetical protein